METPTKILKDIENSVLNKGLKIGNDNIYYSKISKIECLTNQYIDLDRECDEITIDGIEINLDKIEAYEEIVLFFAGNTIVKIDFETLVNLIGKKEKKMYFPKELFPSLLLYSIPLNQNIRVKIYANENINFNLILTKRYVTNIKKERILNGYEDILNQYESYKFENINNINLSTLFIKSIASVGFYIKTNEIINTIKIKLKDEVICEYDYEDIKYYFGEPKIIKNNLNEKEGILYWLSIIPENTINNKLQIYHFNYEYIIEFDKNISGIITNLSKNIISYYENNYFIRFCE